MEEGDDVDAHAAEATTTGAGIRADEGSVAAAKAMPGAARRKRAKAAREEEEKAAAAISATESLHQPAATTVDKDSASHPAPPTPVAEEAEARDATIEGGDRAGASEKAGAKADVGPREAARPKAPMPALPRALRRPAGAAPKAVAGKKPASATGRVRGKGGGRGARSSGN